MGLKTIIGMFYLKCYINEFIQIINWNNLNETFQAYRKNYSIFHYLFIYSWKKKAGGFTKIYALYLFRENSEKVFVFNSFSQKKNPS